jgi:hypothetical protein
MMGSKKGLIVIAKAIAEASGAVRRWPNVSKSYWQSSKRGANKCFGICVGNSV